MTRIAYREWSPTGSTLRVVEQANLIVAEYQQQGFVLTLRQLYYQFVARGLLPNTPRSYKRLGSIVNDARLGGMMHWEAIEDRTRNLASASYWSTPSSIIQSAADSYRENLWASQEWQVEVWIEKEALAGVFEGVCQELRVPYFSCRGYVSQSEMWGAARRLARYVKNGSRVLVIHFGDHDPSGLDMTRDIQDRFSMFGARVEVDRIALNMDQVEEYGPPPNPAKMTDSRYDAYADEFGVESWELDALEPSTLGGLVRDRVAEVRDEDAWEEAEAEEAEGRDALQVIARHFDAASTAAHVAEKERDR